jgi:hypothetical protein
MGSNAWKFLSQNFFLKFVFDKQYIMILYKYSSTYIPGNPSRVANILRKTA